MSDPHEKFKTGNMTAKQFSEAATPLGEEMSAPRKMNAMQPNVYDQRSQISLMMQCLP